MVPDTRYAILGLLRRGPSHGYKIAARFMALLPGWAFNRNQVYDMLGTLVKEGWVERLDPPDTPKDSQRYRNTTKGEREFVKWYAKRSRPPAHRSTLYIKLMLAGPHNAHHLLKDIEIEKQACIDQLSAYNEDEDTDAAVICPPPEDADDWELLAREAIDEDVAAKLHGKLEWLGKLQKRVEHRLVQAQDESQATDDQSAREDEAA
jgi:DNA-binding PadR family transcriptional regulator